MTRYVLDAGARRLDHGLALLAGSPLRLLRLRRAGAAVLDAIERGDPVDPAGATGRLLERLVDAGAIHPVPGPGRWGAADVTVVIPSFGDDAGALAASCAGVAEVIVVDDGSKPPLEAVVGTRSIRLDVNAGPGAARNAGLACVRTALVAFLDTDTVPAAGWLDPLLAHLDDPHVALAAPRVVPPPASPGSGALAAYEATRSPLDLGPEPARIRARTRVSYVPAAALLARVEALRAVGGFNEELRVGEDVDLVWRLDEAGWACRYEPASTVGHIPRYSLGAWLARRVDYGESAGPLARRHPQALAPAAVSGWSGAAWALAAAGWPLAGAALTAGTALALARKLRGLERPVPEAFRLAGLGTLFAGRQLATAVMRVWWPIAVAGAVVSRRARRALLAAAILPALADWRRLRPDLDPLRFTVLHLLDDAAYGLGVWRGALAARTAGPLLPDLTSWPRAGSYERRHGHDRADAAP
jgi:mycofactocin system glycosyltransferase